MRLIDADNLEKDVEYYISHTILTTGENYAYYRCKELIKQQSTIEAEPGEWEWFAEWSPSTTEHPRECDDCGWRCSRCKTALEDMVGGYWDNPDEEPKLNYCPNCGVKMKGAKT